MGKEGSVPQKLKRGHEFFDVKKWKASLGHQIISTSPPFFLTSQCPNLIEIRSKRKKEREEEKKKGSSFLLMIWFRFRWICTKEFVQRSSSSRFRRRDQDPRLRSEICKVLAHWWSWCFDQTSSCGYPQRSGTCVITIETSNIRRIQGMEIWSPFWFF